MALTETEPGSARRYHASLLLWVVYAQNQMVLELVSNSAALKLESIVQKDSSVAPTDVAMSVRIQSNPLSKLWTAFVQNQLALEFASKSAALKLLETIAQMGSFVVPTDVATSVWMQSHLRYHLICLSYQAQV